MWCIGFQKAPEEQTILGGQTLSFKSWWLPHLLVPNSVYIYVLFCFADLVLKDKVFVYDIARQRIGWANYDCKYNLYSHVIWETLVVGYSSSEMNLYFVLTGSMSVNVSVTSGKDIVNSGQPCLNISKRGMFLRFFFSILLALFLYIFFSLT